MSIVTYLLKYIPIFLLQKFFQKLFVNFQCQAKLTDFLPNWLLCNGRINAEIIDFHSLFFALLFWWLVGSAGLLVGHPFDTLKVRLTLTYLIRVLARIIISDRGWVPKFATGIYIFHYKKCISINFSDKIRLQT